jgi:hypothetical protein
MRPHRRKYRNEGSYVQAAAAGIKADDRFRSVGASHSDDRLSDTIEPWTGEEADDYRKNSIVHPDGAVEWGGFMFDGWGNVLGG